MKRGLGLMSIAVAGSIFLAGCASIPAMTTEQEEMVSEYAVSLLLKYDSENHTRLVSTESYLNAYETAKKIHDDAEKKYYDAIAEEEAKRKAEAEEQNALNDSYRESTKQETIVIMDENENHKFSDGTGGAAVVDAETIESFLGLSGFLVQYAGYDIMESYPEDLGELYFAIDATKGNDLLIVYFNVTNTSALNQTLNIYDLNPIFKLSVNGEKYSSTFKTFVLEDDLSMYVGDFNSGEMKRLVLVTEVKDATTISNLGLRISLGDDSLTKSLK